MALVPIGTYGADDAEVLKTYPVANGVTVTKGDAVYFASGRITSASVAGVRVLGVATATVTGNAAGTNKVIVSSDPETIYLADTSSAPTSASVGKFYNLTGATGAQQVDISSASTTAGQVILLEYGTDLTPTGSSKAVVAIAQHLYHQ